MVWGEFSLYRSRSRDYLRDVEVKRDFWDLRSTSDKLGTALLWCRLLANKLPFEQPVDEVLPVLFWSMDLLESNADPVGVDLRFTWRLLKALGIAPSIKACDNCGKAISRGIWQESSFLCDTCGKNGRSLDLSPAAYWIFASHGDIKGQVVLTETKSTILTIKTLISKNLHYLY